MASEATPLNQRRSDNAVLSYSKLPSMSEAQFNKIKDDAIRRRQKKLDGEEQHSYWYNVMKPRSNRVESVIYRWFITTLILVNVAAFVAESDQRLAKPYSMQFWLLEAFSANVFLLEYCIRLWTIPESKTYKNCSPHQARINYMCTFTSTIDVLSFLPWFLECAAGLGDKDIQLPNFAWLRMLRLFRLLKNSMIFEAFDVFARVLYYNAEILILSVILCTMLTLILSTMLYYLRPRNENGQIEQYSSILATMYLATMMLTGQGGPEGVLPWYTKVMVCFCSVFAVGLFAIQASMLTWGFEQEAERRMRKNAERKKLLETRKKVAQEIDIPEEDLMHDSSSSDDDDRERQWEEYEDVVAGSDDEDVEQGAAELTTAECGRAMKAYANLHSSQDGRIQTAELTKIFSKEELTEELVALDHNSDGYTTVEEFIDWLKERKGKDPKTFQIILADLEAVSMHRPAAVAPAGKEPLDQLMSQVVAQMQGLKSENARLKRELGTKA